MKIHQTLVPLVAAVMIAGCGNRGPAERVVAQVESIVAQTRDDGLAVVPAEFKVVESTAASMRQSLEAREYDEVMALLPTFNTQVVAMKDAYTSRQAVLAAATHEWSTLNQEVPKSVEAIQARVDSLKPAALAKDVTREELATARTELEALKTTWAEATAAASSGNTLEATDKGRIVQAKAEELKNQLGMNETLASLHP
jgi:hypothetical protein